jgi:hypothetical protein
MMMSMQSDDQGKKKLGLRNGHPHNFIKSYKKLLVSRYKEILVISDCSTADVLRR